MKRTRTCLAVAAVLFSGSAVAQDSASEPPSIDEILTRLEQKGDEIRDIRCKVEYVMEDGMNLTQHAKRGEIQLLMQKPAPIFLVSFEKTFVDGLRGKREWYLFDGQYLFEALERTEQVYKRRVSNPGETVDLFDIEKAPFPMPFGQKKDKILKNFDIALLPSKAEDPENTWHVHGVAKADSELRRHYETLDLFISRDLNLPVKIVIQRNNGLEVQTADFPDLSEKSLNRGLKEADFKHPKEWRKFKEVEDG